ncbi:hypothetical protein CSUI_006779 [Cystoisospora suis]|uniref:Uncharacterized protein n=1 Tax=Cystoisospora suis TaxID=483139 RepID=A0A2C6KFX3_9APIC|nr:hypothetical protein CSUI_006779 [Cystoisospora suis]
MTTGDHRTSPSSSWDRTGSVETKKGEYNREKTDNGVKKKRKELSAKRRREGTRMCFPCERDQQRLYGQAAR